MAFDYTLDWTDTALKPSFTLPGKTVDTTTTSLALTGKGTLNWGEHLNENLLHLLEHFASNGVPPAHQTIGQMWYNTADQKLNVRGSTAFADVLQPVYDGVAGIDILGVQNSINALKPRIIRASYNQFGWYDWWGGVNMVNFNGQSPTRPGMANGWIPAANSINNEFSVTGDPLPIAYVSSIAGKLTTTFKVDRPSRVSIMLDYNGEFSSGQSLYSINWFYKIERSYDNGATWSLLLQPYRQTWAEVRDTGGNVIGYSSIAMKNENNRFIKHENNIMIPWISAPETGLNSHLIDPSGVDKGVYIDDVPALEANVMHRFTIYATVGVMNNSVQLKGSLCNARFLLLGE